MDSTDQDFPHQEPRDYPKLPRLSATEERISRNPKEVHSPVSTQDDPYMLELNAEQFKNFSSFKNAIEDNLKKQPSAQSVNPTYLEKTCLDIASKRGLTEFVESLLSHGANPNKVNDTQNGAPIHFATEDGHVDTLAALLAHPKINPNLQVKGQTALHIAVKENNLKCADLLLKKGAGANIPDSEGLTALYLAVTENQHDMIELIVKQCQQHLNIDEYKEDSGQTIREVIHQKMPKLSLLSRPENTQEALLEDLKYYLNVNDEENFMKNISFLHEEFPCEDAKDLLKIAAKRDFYEAVRAIGAKFYESPFRIKLRVGQTARIAVQQGYYDTLRELLNIESLESQETNDLILCICMQLEMLDSQVVDDITKHLECLKLILEKEKVNIRFTDNQGNTPLHYVARTGCQEAMTLLLQQGSYIGHMNKFNEPPIARIPAYTLSEYFNNCVQITEKLEFNYRCLMPHQIAETSDEIGSTTCEMETFMYIARNEDLKHLLKHPLLSSFLYIKWHRIRYFLYANFVFYFIFYVLLNAYILCNTYDARKENGTQIANASSHMVSESNVKIPWYQDDLPLFFITMLFLFICREILQLVFCPWRYLTHLRNWLQIVLITLIVAMLFDAGIEIESMVILLSAWELITLIGHHPRMSTGIDIFRTVSVNFVRFLFPYLFLIFAFALIFYMLFKEDTHFSDPVCSFFKTMIMLTGEFNASEIPFLSHPVWSHIVFVLFVFLISIVLLNLLNGFVVSDTTEILSTAELVGLISRLRLIAYFEDMIIKSFKFKFLRVLNFYNPFNFLTNRIFLFPNFPICTKNGTIQFESDSDNNTYYIKTKNGSLKMNPNIIKNIKQMTSNKKQISNNKRIMIMLKKLQKELTVIEVNLNNMVNSRTADDVIVARMADAGSSMT